MSVTYRRSNRSSWCLDTASSTAAVTSSRPLSGYGSFSSSIGRHDYSSPTSVGATGLRGSRGDSTRTGLYPATSGRTSTGLGDSVTRRSSYTSYSTSATSGEASKRDSGYSSSRNSLDLGSGLSQRRKSSDLYSSAKRGADTSQEVDLSSTRRGSRCKENVEVKAEGSSVDAADPAREKRRQRPEVKDERRVSGSFEEKNGGLSGAREARLSRQASGQEEMLTEDKRGHDAGISTETKVLSFGDFRRKKDGGANVLQECGTKDNDDVFVEERSETVPCVGAGRRATDGSVRCDKQTADNKTFDRRHSGSREARVQDRSLEISRDTTRWNEISRDEDRKSKLNGAVKSTPAASAPKPSTTAASAAQKEIERLESLCEARTKELTHTRIQLKATSQGFDAMAVLVNYCCAELNAFECPELAKKLETVQRQLADCLAQISELSKEKDTLGQHLSEVIQEKDEAVKKIEEAMSSAQTEREEHAKVTRDMDDTHNAALTAQRDELTAKHEEAMKKFRLFYEKQMEFMKQGHERQISEVKNEGKLEMNGIRISHLEEIQELRNKHDCQMEELHKQHRNKLEDITCRFESIKLNLSEKVESLRGECEDLRHRARNSEEALQRDADVKVQMALAPFLSLPKEIESLKTVVEMRNEEIQKLRTKNMDLEKQLEEVPIGREKILSLQQKVENLEAIINIKTDHEKQLHERCQVLMRKFDRATRANKRLSMDYEQVMWRMSQSSDFGSSESLTQRQLSRSPPRSPDGRRRTLSPNSAGEVVMRKKRNSHSVGDGERKLRSRSATFVVEKTESSDSHSPSSSPQPKLKRWRKKSEAEEGKDGKSRVERMCHSAGAELISHLEGQDEAPGSTDPSDSMTSSVEMAESLARSVSGVSDSGVYDSMTRSDMLNSSVVSTDSEWAASVNLSMTYDSNIDDLDPDLKSGDFSSLNEVTVLHGSRSVTRSKSGMKASNTVLFCPEKSCEDTKTGPARVEEAVGRPENGDEVFDESVSRTGPARVEEAVGRPENGDEVFDESVSMESSCCSFDNLDLDNGSRLASEDFPPDDPPSDTPGKASEVAVPQDKGDKSVPVPQDKADKSALKSSQAE